MKNPSTAAPADPSFHEISSCEVCGGSQLQEVLDLGAQPLCDDLVPVGSDLQCPRYPINILYCATCRTAHQRYQVPKKTLFPRSYHYRSRFTLDVVNGMRELVASCAQTLGGLAGLKVLDIGCNDGTLLSIFKQQGCSVVGVEPTGAAEDAKSVGPVYNEYFTRAVAERIASEHGVPDIITFTNVFAHIEDLKSLLDALALLTGPRTTIVIENHYFGAVLDRNQFDTFYHEHPRTYSATSFRYIAQTLGCHLRHVELPGRYGGNIRVFMSRAGSDAAGDPALQEREARIGEQVQGMRAAYHQWRDSTRSALDGAFAKYGPIAGKAFPGRAAILVHSLGVDSDRMPVVYEKPGSQKIGNYLPGTRIAIAGDDTLKERLASTPVLLNWAWHISAEITGYLSQLGFRGTLIDVMPSYGERTIK